MNWSLRLNAVGFVGPPQDKGWACLPDASCMPDGQDGTDLVKTVQRQDYSGLAVLARHLQVVQRWSDAAERHNLVGRFSVHKLSEMLGPARCVAAPVECEIDVGTIATAEAGDPTRRWLSDPFRKELPTGLDAVTMGKVARSRKRPRAVSGRSPSLTRAWEEMVRASNRNCPSACPRNNTDSDCSCPKP